MMIQAVLGNPHHPEYGVATIPFPIPRDQYAHCMEMLEALEIGDAVKADCKVEKIDSFYTVLKRVEMLTVNVEELNYLAKRLDSFDTGEAAQFQAMAHKLELFELKDLINLTFCCQQATVITDFSDLAAVGRNHYMNLHGGSASVDELNALDGKKTARQLIESGSGTITPYGVVYDNGMKLEQVYDGRFFPCYYDVTVYPKNQTGSPDLEKTVREDKNSTGKNTGSLTDIADGYAHTATASVGDVVDYQIISTLPTITSKATSLTTYTFVDTLSKGICYNKNDVVIEFFRDAECTDKITTWDEDSGKFAVSYDDAANTMSIGMTEAGLADINESESVYTDSVKRGYSDCTMRITYAATLTADAKLGDTDNPNEVVLTWKRTNTSYYDTLQDCCHLYTYGVDVLKQFSDGKGDLTNVSFLLHNDTDDVYIIAEQRNGMYYVKGFTDKKADATTLVPNDSGHIIVNGLEDDTYTLTEIATDKGYVLLKDGVEIVIAAAESENACETCGAKLLTASGTVNGEPANMESGNAIVPLMVINNPGFDLPKTGGYGTWMFTVGGCMLLGVAAFIVIRGRKHNKNDQ